MKEKYLLIPCLLFLAAGAFAQQKWDLQQCIAHAQAHNIQLKQQEQVVKNQEISLSSARNSRLPGVDASASQSFNFGRGLTIENTYVNRNTLSTSFSANASMSLYDGGQITRNIQVQKLQLEANMADLTRAQEDLSLQVASVYLEVLFQEELWGVARQQCRLSAAQADRIRKLLDAGKASESEWADAKALAAADEMSVTQAENNYRLSLLTLSQLLELPSPEEFSVVKPDLPPAADVVLPLPDAVMAEAVGIKPEIKAVEYRVKGAERSIQLAKTGYYPKLSLGAGLGTGLLTLRACDLRDEGKTAREAAEILRDETLRLCEFFTVDDLNCLKRTGRVSGATAMIGTVLNIKPLLYGDYEGHIVSWGKVRGKKKAIDAILEKYREKAVDPQNRRVAISHGDVPEEAEELARRVCEIAQPKELIIAPHEPFTGSHVGPGMLALFFFGDSRL